MLHSIVGNIICSQFEYAFGRHSEAAGLSNRNSDPHNAMQVQFSLHSFPGEDGYRDLKILLFGGGFNYIGVYAQLDWDVVAEADPSGSYVKGSTPWVLLGYHDSGWREAVASVLWDYRDRLSSIDSLFNSPTGWYKKVPVTPEFAGELYTIRQETPGYGTVSGKRPRLEDMEFRFTAAQSGGE